MKVFTYVRSCSELFVSVCELAELMEWARAVLQEMLAELGLVLLFQSVDLALVAVEAVVVGLVGEASEDLSWWVVEVPWSSVGVNTFSLITSLLSRCVWSCNW